MSYILDALRKADAQRERDPARGIHAQPVLVPLAPEPAGESGVLWLWVTSIGGLAILLAVAVWWMSRAGPPPVMTASPVAAAPPPAVVPPVTATPPIPRSPATEVRPAPPPPAPVPAVVRETPRTQTVTAYPPVPAASAPGRLLSLAELPPEIQQEVPKLSITGGVYSPNAAQRMLIVNGQVLNEGAEPAPGVKLEQIRPKTAVLTYRGYRYGVPY